MKISMAAGKIEHLVGRNPKCSPSDCTEISPLLVTSAISMDFTLHQENNIGQKGVSKQGRRIRMQAVKKSPKTTESICQYEIGRNNLLVGGRCIFYLLVYTFFSERCDPLYSLCSLRTKSYHLKSWRITTWYTKCAFSLHSKTVPRMKKKKK